MTVPFQYTPLKPGEIRLLHHFTRDGIDIWALKAVQIQEQGSEAPVEFDALSYTWGDLGHTFPFECNAAELRIHENLKIALPYLARRNSSLPLWIDAICINQSDDEEKFVQISMMHSIYRQATQVWVWLGCDPEYGEEAISLLPKVAAVGKELESQMWKYEQPSPVNKGLPAFSSPQWGAVVKIINNNWLFRLWIIQEAALARHITVLYGGEEIPWDLLNDAVQNGPSLLHNLRDSNGYKPAPLNGGNYTVFNIRQFTQFESQQEVPFALMRLLLSTIQYHHCYDPRDRVFGVLGFFSSNELRDVGISGEMEVEELYTRLTRFLFANVGLSATNWWNLFNSAWSSDGKMAGLPSWCPDYHNLNDQSHPREARVDLEGHSRHSKKRYDASRGKRVPSLPANPRAMALCGKIFDTVETLLPEFPSAIEWEKPHSSFKDAVQRLVRFHEWEKSLAQAVLGDKSDILPDDPTTICVAEDEGRVKFTLDGYWRSLVGDVTERTGRWGRISTYETYRTFKVSLARVATLMQTIDTFDIDNLRLVVECAFGGPEDPELVGPCEEIIELLDLKSPLPQFLSTCLPFLMGRKPFITSMGRFGFGTMSLQKGDRVCVLNYAKTPHVLRCSDHEVGNYQVICQAYVHDMMYGEVEALGIEEQDIVLV